MIYHYDPRYSLTKLFVDSALRLNFNKIVFTGTENIAKDKPVIFAPNHRNALLDALLIVYIGKHSKQVVFLARADIFKKPFIAWILRGMRIIPVFRIRDGKENLEKNNEIFDIAGRILKKNNRIALFPEARHNPRQSLLPIQKAVPRIVIPTEAQVDFQLDSQIVPVAIYYTDISEFLSDCYVTFGKPISVNNYKSVYEENPNLAINMLRNDLEERMKEIVVNIWNDEFYKEYENCILWNAGTIAGEKFPKQKNGVLQATHHIVRELDRLFKNERPAFNKKITDYKEAAQLLESHGLSPKDNIRRPVSTVAIILKICLLVMTSPVAIFGLVNNIFPVLIYKRLRSLFKDQQFIPSVRYVSGLFFVPVFDVIQSLVVNAATHDWKLTLLYFTLMPLCFLFAIHWRRKAKSVNRQWRVNRFVNRFPAVWEKLTGLIQFK